MSVLEGGYKVQGRVVSPFARSVAAHVRALAGGFAVGADATSLTEELIAVLVFALVATSTALVPLVAYLLRGDRALGTLGRAKDWLTKRSDVVMSAIMVVFGILLVWKGWGAL